MTLRVDSDIRYQTIEGWGATVWDLGIPFDDWEKKPTAERYDQLRIKDPVPEWLKAKIMDASVFQLGLNRFRLEIGPQVEIRNDNGDSDKINDKAFRFKWQDFLIQKWLLPMKHRIEQRGEKMVLYISYDLSSSLTPQWLLQPEEYAEMAVATLIYFKKRYSIEPDYWSVLNEPGNHRPGTPQLIAEILTRTGMRIREAGFRTRMSGPEVVTPKQITAYMKALIETPGALDQLGQLTYHLYWDPGNIIHRNEIHAWATKLGITAAQTEWLEGRGLNVVETLYLDLTEAHVSAWEQYGLSWTANRYNKGGGGDYFVIKRDFSGYYMNSNAWYLRQFMRYVRPGDVRVGIYSPKRWIKPVAFLKPDGRQTVVVINSGSMGESIRIEYLPTGAYEMSVTDEDSKGKLLSQQSIEAGQALTFEIPRQAIVTVYGTR